MNPTSDQWTRDAFTQLRSSVPTEVKDRIEATLSELDSTVMNQPLMNRYRKRNRRINRTGYRIVTLLAGTCLLFSSLWFINNGSSFADQLKPWIQSIFAKIGDSGLADIYPDEGGNLVTNAELPLLSEIEDQGYTLRIHETMYDGMRLSFSYSLLSNSELFPSQYVIPSFQLDPEFKKIAPSALKADSGGNVEDGKIGIVNYYFANELPEEFTLKIQVPKLGIQSTDEDTPYNIVTGNWNFEIPIIKQGSVTQNNYGEKYTRSSTGVTLQAIKSRLASHSSEWNFQLEYPDEWARRNTFDEDEEFTYGLKFKLLTDHNSELSLITRSDHSEKIDRSIPMDQWMRRTNVQLFTEPVPTGVSSVTVVPILMKFPRIGDGEYSEQAIHELTLELPVSVSDSDSAQD